ncbi:MAG TPA: 4Fe-4S dicluster domain-containing protein, partial [Vicinamibacterales bacterium]|nr:4Fe-4S dicluster domain-containing protein [Vicinamibacterales bacterium]
MSGTGVAHGPTTDNCRYCWMCRHVCPTGFVTKRETHTPHGYALLIASATRGVSAWNAETIDALYHCADCGCCESHCATHQPLPEAIVGARASLAAAGLAPAAAVDVQARLDRWGSIHGDPGPRPPQATGPVGLFVGDAVPPGETRAVDAALGLLARAGLAAVVVGAGRSTGLVASALGFVDTAKRLAAAVLADVAASGCRQLLVLGPGDRFAFDRAYASRLGVAWPEGVRVREATAALAEAHASGTLRFQPPPDSVAWAYQEPDHAVRV